MKRGEQKVLLLILDGWGIRNSRNKNAVKTAKTPVMDKLWKQEPHTVLKASGPAVGLPKGYMGNSEVGHLTIGAGRVCDTDLLRINKSIKDGSFYRNKALLQAMDFCNRKKKKLHLIGLLSDAGVHSHLNHLFALLKLAKKKGLKEVYVHAFLDGRDTPPKAAEKYLNLLQVEMKQIGVGKLATMMGRFYAMDRDNRWKREHKAYDAMVNQAGRKGETGAVKALKKAYSLGETDEFVRPIILVDQGAVDEGDSVIFFNFRSDRARELTKAFVLGEFNEFKRKKIIDLCFVTLTQYDSLAKVPVAYPPLILHNTLGKVISVSGRSQLRIAETEKWAHVTYFFNGLCEGIFPNEKRIHLKSDRKVRTYDQLPEMKVKEITNTLLKNINHHDFFVVNFANGDMVGHSGNFKATVKAVEAMDREIGRIVDDFPGLVFITADHGNCEEMTSGHETAHSVNPVPLIIANGKKIGLKNLRKGGLADLAPTVLDMFKIKKPKEMKGKSLIIR
ncbi:MAG: 2,3-bisphosphoglycerate-independent phosphoglycerate mutase [Nanoarchaeota archaeon]